MAVTTAISTEKVVLSQILKYIDINFNLYINENELRVSIDEDKLISSIHSIAKHYTDAFRDYTGSDARIGNIDKIIINIGDYTIEALEERTIIHQSVSNGFKKVAK